MDIAGRKVLVLGLGVSGCAAARFLINKGARVIAADSSDDSETVIQSAAELTDAGAECRIGDIPESVLDDVHLIIVSPGVPNDNKLVQKAIELRIPIMSEPELASRFTRASIIAVTGTNGKTTTTTLIGEILKSSGLESVVAGNIGYPMICAVEEVSAAGFLVIELSSFQLDHIIQLRPEIAVLLNITEDHLDRHGDFSAYVESKKRVFMNQTTNDYAIVSADDPVVLAAADGIRSRLVKTSKFDRPADGAYTADDMLVVNVGSRQTVCRIDELRLTGSHNLDNALAATAAAVCAGVKVEHIRQVLKEFAGLPHRLQKIGVLDGISFYDDSKATNPDAVLKAVTSFDKPVILLAGGRNKGYDFSKLAPLADSIKAIEAFGEAGSQMAADLAQSGITIKVWPDLEAAFEAAQEIARTGDIILLSPACASFDQYKDYKARGEHFIELVNRARVKKDRT